MGYEELLSEAYENVEQSENCGRFEVLEVKGHHEGNKTILTNFLQVASCIRREPETLAKFLFKELATSGEVAGDRLILARKLSSSNINDKVKKFVDSYVICPNCSKPDTAIVNDGKEQHMKCLACGHKKQIPNKF